MHLISFYKVIDLINENKKFIAIALVSSLAACILTSAVFVYACDNDEKMPYDIGINATVIISVMDGDLELNTGTGFAVNFDGIKILTNAHLFSQVNLEKSSENILLMDAKGNKDSGSVLYIDMKNDIAILTISSGNLSLVPLKLNTHPLDYGKKIFTSSNARGYGISVQDGIISIPSIIINSNDIERLSIQTTIPLNKGSSGAPLIDEDGCVIGMMSFRMRDETGNIVQGLSYAIPSSLILNSLYKL